MYQRIMVAIDSNFASGKVLDTGIEMARRFGAQLALCHALDDTILAQQFAREPFEWSLLLFVAHDMNSPSCSRSACTARE